MRKTFGKAVAAAIVASLVLGTALTGCGKKDVDYSLDGDGNGGAGGDGTLAGRLGIPESYDGTVEGIDEATGLTEVTISDSEIETPDSDKMSIVYYEDNVGDSDYKKRVCESFFDANAGIYVYDWENPYKEDVEREISSAEKLAKEVTSDEDKQYYDEYIAELQEQLKTATTEREGAGNYSADSFVGSVGENMFIISFMSNTDGNTAGFSISYYPSASLIEYKSVDGATSTYFYSAEFADEDNQTNTASMSQEDAAATALDFLAGCGITDVIQTGINDLMWDFSDAEYNTVSTEKNGYVVSFKRSVDGNAPYTPYVYNLDIFNTSNVWYDTADETFDISLDDNGILEAYCYDYYKATGDKEDGVSLISWEDALKSLTKAVNTCYTKYTTNYSSIAFNDVRLTYYKVKDDAGYKYIPVWAFAECEEYEGTIESEYPTQLILLDATTGDYIDLAETYEAEGLDVEVNETDDTDDSEVEYEILEDSDGEDTFGLAEDADDGSNDGSDETSDDTLDGDSDEDADVDIEPVG